MIPVPAHWDMHGFGTLNYKKDVGSALQERGLYQHSFPAPERWRDKRVFLVFEGVMTDTSVKVNGTSAGPRHQGGFYRFQYEVTELLKYGAENLLQVDVAKHSANESINKAERTADYWVFGGIYRPVYLKIVPPEFIERIAVDALADGDFSADVYCQWDPAAEPLVDRLVGQIYSAEGRPVGAPFAVHGKLTTGEPAHLTTHVDAPFLWTAETPHLYQVEVCLYRRDVMVHRVTQRFGFRTVEVRPGDGIYLNGQRIILKGVNRHSTWPDSGRCLSEEVHRLDIETIQAMNMNAVRMSHYPPDEEFLDLCDELGLYVLDELAGWHGHYDTHVGGRLVKEMVTRDVNHPSILFWDNGNEGGFNRALDERFTWFDPQRRSVLHPYEVYQFINTAHYLEYDRARLASAGAPTRHGPGAEFQEWEDLNDPNKYIYMPTEMLHGLYDGGSGAGLSDYWTLMRQSPVLGGGFLWVLFDEGIKRPDGTIDCAGNQAPDGIVGPYRQREGSFYTVQQIWSPIQLKRGDGNTITIANEYSFTNARDCRLTWQLRRFLPPSETEDECAIVAAGEQPLPDIPPGATGELQLKLPQPPLEADALAVRVDDPGGRELWTWVWPEEDLLERDFLKPDESSPAPSMSVPSQRLAIRSGNLTVTFDTRTGKLEQIRRGDQSISFTNGPACTLGESEQTSFTYRQRDTTANVEAHYSGPLQSVVWTIHNTGWVDCEYAYRVEGAHDYFGVTFDYPAEFVQGKRWLGDGPFRVWKNRRLGVSLGLWHNKFNNTITGYSGWLYPEFAGCFANIYWLQLLTSEGPITVVPDDQTGFVQVLTPQQPPNELEGNTRFSLPECGLAILDAIPPVGSKFKPAATTGPHGQQSSADGPVKRKVSFYFGEFQ